MTRNSKICALICLGVIGIAIFNALADYQYIPFVVTSGSGGSGCLSSYNGYAKMTNSAGSIWITPPANTSTGTFTDASGFRSPYVSVAYVVRNSDGSTWCDTNSVTFPATSSDSYQLIVFVTSTLPPPTNGQPLELQLTWH